MVPQTAACPQNPLNGLIQPIKATCDGDKFEKFELLKERFKSFADKNLITTNDNACDDSIEMTDEQRKHHQILTQQVQTQITASIAFMTVETDLKEIRDFLRATREKMEDKEAKAKTINDWKQVALVLDRTFFFIYLIAIIISLAAMFPR